MRGTVATGLRCGKILALFAVLIVSAEAHADFVLSAQSVLSAPPTTGGFTFDQTINQSGLSAGYTSGVTDFSTYVGGGPIHTRNNSPPNYGVSSSLPPQNIDYDLGSAFNVQRMAFWNYPFSGSAGVASMQIFTSSVPDFSTSFLAGTFNPLDDGDGNAGTGINHVQVFDVTDSNARYIRLHVTTVNSSNGTGFSEVAFGASAVPEPTSLAAVGACAIGMSLKRRRSRVK